MTSASRRILVVDDDPASNELVAYYLKSLGYNVAIAADGSRALNMDLGDDIELIILDVHLPQCDGDEVLLMLRERHPSRPVKVLALTADESNDARESMQSAGADGFLTKPVDLDLLRDEVIRLMPGGSQVEGALHRRVRERGITPPSLDPRAALKRS
jgi:two-component system, sensor histidine kinase and response regulator